MKDPWKYFCNWQTSEIVILQDDRLPYVPGGDSVKIFSPLCSVCSFPSLDAGFHPLFPTPTLLFKTALVVPTFSNSAFSHGRSHSKTTGVVGTGAELVQGGIGRGVATGLGLRPPPPPCFRVLICRWFPLVLSSSLG